MTDIFINLETHHPIARTPSELPPLRKGFVRLIHQTSIESAQSLIKNGLIYNREYANRIGESFSKYTDIESMAVIYGEDDFWERLTCEGIRHKGSDSIAIFDMPMEECKVHRICVLAQFLNGTISRGYLVGFIPNYGTKDDKITQKLSQSDMLSAKAKSLSNELPPYYETPNWRENIKKAEQAWQNTEFDVWPPISDKKSPEKCEMVSEVCEIESDDWSIWDAEPANIDSNAMADTCETSAQQLDTNSQSTSYDSRTTVPKFKQAKDKITKKTSINSRNKNTFEKDM